MYLPQPKKGAMAKLIEMVQPMQVRKMALPVVSFGPLKPLQIMLYLSKEIKHNSQMLVTPVTAPVGEKKRGGSVDLTIGSAEHPNTTTETVVGKEGNVGGQHDEVRQSEIHHEDVSGSPESLGGRDEAFIILNMSSLEIQHAYPRRYPIASHPPT
ncbi:hypothetical protein E2C01_036409 [Portunus trituberculatus]|uniref:Uncharacterized protein n=1 Tax=Portunus trituberculatus TaxID=210409 RepID=A0A5B7FCD9_PORTR|nr:hypothetical protein [Portunus trituberculatus]